MFRKRVLRLAIAAATIGMAIVAGANRAEAALRITLTSGIATQYYYSSTDSYANAAISIDGYTMSIQTASDNQPTSTITGTLQQTLTISTNTPTPGDLSSFVEVINPATLGALPPTGQITNPAQIALLLAAPLLPYTSPTGTGMVLTADVSGASNATLATGTLRVTSTSPTSTFTTVSTSNVDWPTIGGTNSASTTGVSSPFTLTNLLTLTGVTGNGQNVSNVNATGTTSVTGVPEPAPVALALTGLPVLGLLCARRRRQRA